MTDTIAVIRTQFAWSLDPDESSGLTAALTLYGDQTAGDIKTNVSRKVGSIVADDIPSLLRTVADFMVQEGATSLDEIAERLQEAKS